MVIVLVPKYTFNQIVQAILTKQEKDKYMR